MFFVITDFTMEGKHEFVCLPDAIKAMNPDKQLLCRSDTGSDFYTFCSTVLTIQNYLPCLKYFHTDSTCISELVFQVIEVCYVRVW